LSNKLFRYWLSCLKHQKKETTFNRSIRIEARPERLTTDPGAVLLREIMERLGIVS